MGSCSHEILQSQILQSRSVILVPLVRSSSHVTVQTLQSSQQPVLQSSKCACSCLAVPNLAVINLAGIHLAVRKPTLLGSCSHEIMQSQILQSRSKILVPLVRHCSRVTVQTLQSSHSQSCSPPNALASVLQSQILQSSILQSSILQSGNPHFCDLAVMRSCSHNSCSQDPRFWSHL